MKIKRIYKGSDRDMFSKVGGCMSFFMKHLADFTAFDPQLNMAYYNAWKQAYETAGTLALSADDEEETEIDGMFIADSDKVLARCRAKYKDVKYYAGKAFPDDKAALKEFGESTYSKVRNSRQLMVQFMETLYGVATKYKAELLAHGYTQPAIDEIDALASELRQDNKVQQLKKKERPTQTRNRIEALNTFYGFGRQVTTAAREVYRDNEGMRSQFRLALRHHPKLTKTWLALGAGDVRKTAITRLLKKYDLTLTNQGKETIEYWQADHINQTPAHKNTLTAGEIISIEAETPARKFLVMQNTSDKPVRLMMTKKVKEK